MCGTAIRLTVAPVVTVWDAQGKQLARNRHLVEPIVELKVGTLGDYLVGVNDHVFAGGTTHAYRLRVYAGPYLMAVSPSTAQPGVMQTFSLLGRNLPVGDGGPTMSTIEFEHRAVQSSRINLLVPARHMAAELERGRVAGGSLVRWHLECECRANQPATASSCPLASNPQSRNTKPIRSPLRRNLFRCRWKLPDRFIHAAIRIGTRFEAKAGESFQLRVISHRLGHPTDPEIFVQKVVKATAAIRLRKFRPTTTFEPRATASVAAATWP